MAGVITPTACMRSLTDSVGVFMLRPLSILQGMSPCTIPLRLLHTVVVLLGVYSMVFAKDLHTNISGVSHSEATYV
jgi:hypothetical protein